jgi:hypothetical protein
MVSPATPQFSEPLTFKEFAMDARLNFTSVSSIVRVAAALAAVIAIGIFRGIVSLFQSRGAPMQSLVAPERACAPRA